MTIKWNPDLGRYSGPRYKALASAIADGIRAGELAGGQQLPTHRYLAEQLSVTVGTVTRGYAEAERRDLVTARMGSGTFVRGDTSDVTEFLIPAEEQDGVIDLSLSFSPHCDEEAELSRTLSEIGLQPQLLSGLLRYQAESGLPRFRQAVAVWLRGFGIERDARDILPCLGGQNGISIALQASTRPGDRILTEGLTYPGFLSAAKQQHLRVTGIPLDEQGLVPEQLDRCCRQYQPSVLYCTPTLQNPTIATATEQRRRELLDVAERHGLLVIEDEVQAGLKKCRPPSLATLNPDRVVHIGSFSKTLAGGLRIGYILGPSRFMQRAGVALRSGYWMVPPLMAEVVTNWINSGKAEQVLKRKRTEIEKRHDLVSRIFSGLPIGSDPASCNIWLRLPEPWQPEAFVRQLEERGVRVKPSRVFTAGRFQAEPGVRICIGTPPRSSLVEKGLQIIRDTLDDGPDLLEPVM